jgi:MinD superfamily P-loop ATPase
VINRYGMGNDDVISYCEKEAIPVLAKIPHSIEAAKLYSQGKLIYKEIETFKDEMQSIALYLKQFSKERA